MVRFFIDLYSITHEFYRTRNAGAERVLAEGICIVTAMAVVMNITNAFELVVGRSLAFLPNTRLQIIAFGVALYCVGMICVKRFIHRYEVLQSPERMRERSRSLAVKRKAWLLAVVVSNLVLLIALAEWVQRSRAD